MYPAGTTRQSHSPPGRARREPGRTGRTPSPRDRPSPRGRPLCTLSMQNFPSIENHSGAAGAPCFFRGGRVERRRHEALRLRAVVGLPSSAAVFTSGFARWMSAVTTFWSADVAHPVPVDDAPQPTTMLRRSTAAHRSGVDGDPHGARFRCSQHAARSSILGLRLPHGSPRRIPRDRRPPSFAHVPVW